MTDEELWKAIHAHNQRQKTQKQKLTELRKLLSDSHRLHTVVEFSQLLNRIRMILEQEGC